MPTVIVRPNFWKEVPLSRWAYLGRNLASKQIRKSSVVENGGHRVPDLPHDDSGPASFNVPAFYAGLKGGFAGTRQRRQGALDHAYHRAQRDSGRWPAEMIAAALSFLTLKDAVGL